MRSEIMSLRTLLLMMNTFPRKCMKYMRSEDNLADLSERVVDIDSTLRRFFLIELK
jgi:hypothetical protein